MQIKSAMAVLQEMNDGHKLTELSEALHAATQAVRTEGKPAKVTLEFTIAPARKGAEKLIEAPVLLVARITSKLPEGDPDVAYFFVDEDGNLVRNPSERQGGLDLKIASNQQ